MNPFQFVKATACGNDFLIAEGSQVKSADMVEVSRRICDRHLGVGADGVEWLFPASDADVTARLLNADGSEAEISGNGTRCVAAWLAAQTDKRQIVIRTGAGLKTCSLVRRDGMEFEFRTAMGEPQVGADLSVRLAFRSVTGTPVSTGNPHYVMFVDQFQQGWQGEAAEIGQHYDFKHGTNVELVRVLNRHEIEIRIFERGAGETQSSGTGSCASAVASIYTQRAKSPLKVVSPGGPQIVEWDRELFLTGPAQILCKGEFYY